MRMIHTVDELRLYVRQVLCQRHDLEPGLFPMQELPLTRHGRPCGMLFSQLGPRLMRITAVWDAEQGVLVFYDSAGQRFQKEHIVDGPQLQPAAA